MEITIAVIILLAVVVYLVYPDIPGRLKAVIGIIVAIAIILWLLSILFGIGPGISFN